MKYYQLHILFLNISFNGTAEKEDELGGSATRSGAKADAEPMSASSHQEDDGESEEDSPFGFRAIAFWMTYFGPERLPFYSVASASDPSPKPPLPPANMSPEFLKGQAAIEMSKKVAPVPSKVPVLDQKTQAMQVAAENSKVTACATQELARAGTLRLRQDSAQAMVTRLVDDIKEASAELAELDDDDEKDAKRKEIDQLKKEKKEAVKRQKMIIEESMQPTQPSFPISITPATASAQPSPLRIEGTAAAALIFSSPSTSPV